MNTNASPTLMYCVGYGSLFWGMAHSMSISAAHTHASANGGHASRAACAETQGLPTFDPTRAKRNLAKSSRCCGWLQKGISVYWQKTETRALQSW